MEKSSVISKRIKEEYLKNMKAHATSYPVIRYENGKAYLAVYAFYYDKQDLTIEKKIARPKNYALLDFDTGVMEETYDCRRHDFTKGSFDKKIDISDATHKPTEKELEEAFEHLDKAREQLKAKQPFLEEYEQYMKVIMAQTPKEYQRFYKDLSQTEKSKQQVKPTISIPPMPESVNGRGRRAQRDAIGNVNVEEKAKEAFQNIFGVENKRPIEITGNTQADPEPKEKEMEMDQGKMQEILSGDLSQKTKESIMKPTTEKSEYTYQDVHWLPKQDLSQLPERYFQIARRISEKINFLPCEKPQIRFEFPIFCFRHDSNPGVDSWMMMQGMVMHRDLPKGHFRPKSNSSIYVSCSDRERCLFYTCPYVIAAYIKYLLLTNPKELERQRKEYEANKEEVDTEGNPGYSIFRTKLKRKFSVRDVKKARKFIDEGHFNMSRKVGSADIFVVTYTSDPEHDQTPAETIKPITSFSIKKEQIEQGIMDGDLRMLNNKPIPKGVDVLIFTDYLIRTGKIVEMIPKKDPNDVIVLDF